MSYENNVKATINAAVAVAATTIQVVKAVAPYNDPPADGGVLVLQDDMSAPTKWEIITYTGRTDNTTYWTLTGVAKGAESTTDQAWSSGDHCFMAVTASVMGVETEVVLATVAQTTLTDQEDVLVTHASDPDYSREVLVEEYIPTNTQLRKIGNGFGGQSYADTMTNSILNHGSLNGAWDFATFLQRSNTDASTCFVGASPLTAYGLDAGAGFEYIVGDMYVVGYNSAGLGTSPFYVEVSDDNTNWTEIGRLVTHYYAATETVVSMSGRGRYVRITPTAYSGSYAYIFWSNYNGANLVTPWDISRQAPVVLTATGDTVCSESAVLSEVTSIEQTSLNGTTPTTAISLDNGATYSAFTADHGVVAVPASSTTLLVKVHLDASESFEDITFNFTKGNSFKVADASRWEVQYLSATETSIKNVSGYYQDFKATIKHGSPFSANPAATQGEMETGTESGIRAMSPLKVAQAIAALAAPVYFSATGGTETTYTSGGVNYKVHIFTSSGTFTAEASGSVEVLLVAGGGGASGGDYATGGGGAGAGGLLTSSLSVTAQGYPIVIGAGGTGTSGRSVRAGQAGSSTGFSLTAIGGGAGASHSDNTAQSGGSGGGGAHLLHHSVHPGGAGTSGQGNAGGAGTDSRTGGGGGGKGSVGAAATTSQAGAGGHGQSSTLRTGSSINYAGGGGGGASDWNDPPAGGRSAGAGGSGGGGAGGHSSGANASVKGINGATSTGGGAGGSAHNGSSSSATSLVGANGGSGIVIIRYAVF
jgi:hypothetical protein